MALAVSPEYDIRHGRGTPYGLPGYGPAALKIMVIELGKDVRIMFVYGLCQPQNILNRFRSIGLYHALPRVIARMDGELTHNDQATSSLGPSPVVSYEAVI